MNGINLSELLSLDQLLIDTSFGSLQILLSLSMTFLMAMFIYYVYKKTYNGVLYSKNYNITLVITALAINAIIIGISGNLILSLGLVGALSIVRFRTAVKDPRDTAFMFWAITIGVVNGVAYYELSIIASIFIAGVIAVLSRKASFEPTYMLILHYTGGEVYERIKTIFDDSKRVKRFFVRSDMDKEGRIEKVIEVKFLPDTQEKILEDIRDIAGVSQCTLLASNGEFAE
jgi:uncharacterized membrane protein YhiD involved in acid resistance